MVERGDELDVRREQHAVAEDVAGHVADADDREVVVWTSMPSSRKWRLTDSHAPRAVIAHRLVVVAGRAAGGERVAEPEAVLRRDPVRDVRERGRALVGGDDEVRVVAVVADDVRRRHDARRRAIGVGEVEQAADERPVALDDLRRAAPRGRPAAA